MTWEELKEEAKKMGLYIRNSIWFEQRKRDILFSENGNVCVIKHPETTPITIATKRSYDQMLAIMKALQ